MILTITLNTSIDKRYVVSRVKNGAVNRVLDCKYSAGGKGLNVTRALAISGMDVIAGGIVGGCAGSYIEAKLSEEGIDRRFYHVSGESRSCINIWDEESKCQTEYLEPGFEVAQEDIDGFLAQYQGLLEEAEIITVSGSVPRNVGPKIYAEMIDMAKSRNKKIILDTSGEAFQEGLKAGPTLVKPNIDEIRAFTGSPCSEMKELVQAAEEIYRGGIDYVVVSLGAEGAVMACEEGTFRAQVPKIQTVNTVGCGDSMIAGFAESLAKKETAEQMLRRASAISTASALDRETGHYQIEDMKDIYDRIKVTKLQNSRLWGDVKRSS